MKALSDASRNGTEPMRLSRFAASPDDVAPPSEYGPGRIASPIISVPQNEMRDNGVELHLVMLALIPPCLGPSGAAESGERQRVRAPIPPSSQVALTTFASDTLCHTLGLISSCLGSPSVVETKERERVRAPIPHSNQVALTPDLP